MTHGNLSLWFSKHTSSVHPTGTRGVTGETGSSRKSWKGVWAKSGMGMTEVTSFYCWRTTLLYSGLYSTLSHLWDDGILLEWHEQMTSTWLGHALSPDSWSNSLKKTGTSKEKNREYRSIYSWIPWPQRFLLGWQWAQDSTTKERKNTREVLLRKKEDSYRQEWHYCR